MEKKFNGHDIAVIAGLGNPGEEYRGTYHNVGWSILDQLAAGTAFRAPRGKRFAFARTARGIPLVKPNTFMNESGDGIAQALAFLSVRDTSALLVIHDDSDLPLGEWRTQFGRGAAGHKGVASIIARLGTRDFWRIRVGIRPDGEPGKRRKAGSFVLKRPARNDAPRLAAACTAVVETLVRGTATELPTE
jgi:peptidyl-tRNA hydrolase, PTH1 family